MKQFFTRMVGAVALTVMMVAAATAGAQEVSLEFGQPAVGLAKGGGIRLLGSDGRSVVCVTESGLIPQRSIVSYDMQQREQGVVPMGRMSIKGEWSTWCDRAIVNGDKIDLLMATEKDNRLTVTHERRDMATLALEGEPQTLVDLQGSKKDMLHFHSAVSPNGELVATVSVKVEQGLDAEVRVTLYSRTFEEYWSMDVPSRAFGSLMVTDEGEVVMAGMSNKDRDTRVRASVLDGENVESHEFVIEGHGTLFEWAPACYADNRLVMVATVRDESKTFMRAGSNIDCIDAVSCNMQNGEAEVDRHRFSDEELARMQNRDGVGTNYRWMDMGNLQQVLTDGEGAFVVVDNQWDTYDKYGLVRRERRGMMVLRVGKDGRFGWVHTERTYTKAKANQLDWLKYGWVRTKDGIMLAWSTNPKDARRGQDEGVKGGKVFGLGELTVLTLDREGNATRNRFNTGKQSLFLYPTPLADGEWLLIATEKRRGSIGRLTVK